MMIYCSPVLQGDLSGTSWGRNARLKAESQVLRPDLIFSYKAKKIRCALTSVRHVRSRKYSFFSVAAPTKSNNLFNAAAVLIGLINGESERVKDIKASQEWSQRRQST